jgi:hypothetical protein
VLYKTGEYVMAKLLATCGFLEVTETSTSIVIKFDGSVGDTIEGHVAPLFDRIYGEGAFDRVRQVAKEECGSPDHVYSLKFTKPSFKKAIAG